MPSAIVSALVGLDRLAGQHRLRERRARGGLDADDRDVRPRGLDRERDAGAQAAAADRDRRPSRGPARPRAARGRASPGRRRSPGRRTGARTRARRSRSARAPRPGTRRRCCRRRGRSRPCSRAASTFAIGASAGTKTSHGMPICAAAAASAWPWLPALAATTPLAALRRPSAASLAATPRTLKEPVRCRFSALSTTVPPARSLNVRVERIGVRRATVSTAARAASTSLAVTLTAR